LLPSKNNFGGIAMIDGISDIEVSDNEIREYFKMLTLRPITHQTVSAGKCIAKAAQWHIIEILKLGLMPIRVGNYYLMKADVLDRLFEELDKSSIESANKQ